MEKIEVLEEAKQKFKSFAKKFFVKDWSPTDIILYLDIAVLSWNTSLLKKPERITEIQKYINSHSCSSIQLGSDTYDTLEFAVTLAHLKKALFPEVRKKILSVDYQPEKNNIQVIFHNP